MSQIRYALILLILFIVPAAGQTTGKNPVIIIPGLTGSELVNSVTGKAVWFTLKRDSDDDIRLPITSSILSRNRDNLISPDIIREVKVPILPDIEVYQAVLDALKSQGYTEADWKSPKATDVFYVFPYDWRRDNVESAQLLMEKMAAVKRAVKRPKLKFDILAHSMGGLIARYAAMYGAADLPREGVKPVPNWKGAAHINKLMMFGTPNHGTFNAFDALLNGYPIAGRKLPLVDDVDASDVLTTPSAFQLLPSPAAARFLDENLEPIKVDLYDPATWFHYGWGALTDPKYLSKLADAAELALTNKDIKPSPPGEKAKAEELLTAKTTFSQAKAYFTAVLSRAKRFHMALAAESKTVPVQYYAYGGNCADTLDAAIIVRDTKKNKWITIVEARDIKAGNGREVKKDAVKKALFVSGDGRVTRRSLEALDNAGNPRLPFTSTFFSCGAHSRLFLEKPIQDSFLSALAVTAHKQP